MTDTVHTNTSSENVLVSMHRTHVAMLKEIYEERIAIRDRRIAELEAALRGCRSFDMLLSARKSDDEQVTGE